MTEWKPMSIAPLDGTIIIGLINGEEIRIRWMENLAYVIAGNVGGNGYSGPGWQDVDNRLACESAPKGWRPADLQEHLERSRQIVSTWPAWKRNVLGYIVASQHISINGAEPGSLVHAAESWLLAQGLLIPSKAKHPAMFQGMLDDFSESKAGQEFIA